MIRGNPPEIARIKDLLEVRWRTWRDLFIIVAGLWACIQIGTNVSVLPQGLKAAIVLTAAIPIGLKWGSFGYLCAMVAMAPFELPEFNYSRIPILGWVFEGALLRERVVLTAGGVYLGGVLLRCLHRRERWSIIPFLPLGIVVIYGAMVALLYAWYPGESEFQAYAMIVLYGAVVFSLVWATARTPAQYEILVDCMIISGLVFSIVSVVLPPSISSYMADETGGGRLGGTWTLPLGVQIRGNPVYVSTYLALSGVLAYGKLLASRDNRTRAVLLAVIAMTGYSILLTISRTGLYGEVAGLAAMTAIYLFAKPALAAKSNERPSTRVFAPQILVPVIFLGLAGLSMVTEFNLFVSNYENPYFVFDRLFDPFYGDSAQGFRRVELTATSLGASISYPAGIGTRAMSSLTGFNDHSLYTLMFSALGWIGTAAFLYILVWCTVHCMRSIRSTDPTRQRISMLLLGGIVTLLIMGFGHPILGTLWGVTLFWALLGTMAAMARNGT